MGLDITAYSRLEPVGVHTDGWCEQDDHVLAFAYADFPASFRGIPVLAMDRHDGITFLDGGCYQITEETTAYEFSAGAYGSYGRWREDLLRQFNPTTDPQKPFFELIWFADNEGCIGPEAARDLLVDFQEHVDRYQPGPDAGSLREKYTDWMRAFELAADRGLVNFH